MIIEYKKIPFYIDNKLNQEIEIYCRDIIDSNEDLVILIDGPEGAGKSKLARQLSAKITLFFESKGIESDFGVENIHFNINEYISSSLKGAKYQINILDESRKVLNRRRATSKDTVRFTDYLSECRSKNQIHLILLPSYCDIDKYIIMWRAKVLLHCKKSRDSVSSKLIKGEGRVIPLDKQLLFFWDRGYYEYPKFNPKKYGGFQYRWNDVEVLSDIKKYEKKKDDNMILKYETKPKENNEVQELKDKAVSTLDRDTYMKLFGVCEKTFYRHKKKLRDQTKDMMVI